MKKAVLTIATIVMLAVSTGSVGASTAAELQAQLAKLQAQLAQIEQSVKSSGATSRPLPPPPVPITRTLSRGMRGEDVRAVQQFLISQGLLGADSATGFFGALTENAVKEWQKLHGIVSSGTPATTGYGAVGPRTRGAMAQMRPGAFVQRTGQPAQSSYTVTTSPSYSQSTYDTSGCTLPWGGKVGIGSIIVAYKSPAVPSEATCESEERKCEQGVLSGSYGYQSCTVSAPVSSMIYSQGTYNSQGSSRSVSQCLAAFPNMDSLGFFNTWKQSRAQTNRDVQSIWEDVTGHSLWDGNLVSYLVTILHNGTASAADIRVSAANSTDASQTIKQVWKPITGEESPDSNTYGQIISQLNAGSINAGSLSGIAASWSGLAAKIKSVFTSHAANFTLVESDSNKITESLRSGAIAFSDVQTIAECVAGRMFCTFNNQQVAHGASVTAYQAASVSSRNECISEMRTCNNGTLSGAYTNPSCTKQTGTMQVKVLQLNIKNPWSYTTTHEEYVNTIARIGNTVLDTQADIVGTQEVVADVFVRLSAHLAVNGWSSIDLGPGSTNAVFTRYKIIGPAGKYGAQVRLPSGGVAYIFSMHNMDSPYEPYNIAGWSGCPTCGRIYDAATAEASARATRMSITNAYLSDMAPYLASGAPVFLVGDMNEPSHLDWTAASVSAGLHPFAVTWPTSKAIVDAGFVDTYRATHPNEVASPGITWTTTPAPNEPLDRIDFVYADPGSKVIASYTIGDGLKIPADIISTPAGVYWSDHAGVMSTLNIKADFQPIQ